MTVVSDVVIDAIGGLDPRVKDLDEVAQRNGIGLLDEKLDVQFL